VATANDDGAAGGDVVDPAPFRGGAAGTRDNFYFITPSGKHWCAFEPDLVGCNSLSLPADAPKVEASDGSGEMVEPNAVTASRSQRGQLLATGDPSFVYQRADGGFGEGKVLEYGQVLRVYGASCTVSEKRGVTCETGRHGFTFSSAEYSLH